MKALEYLLNFKTNKASFSDAEGNVKSLKESFLGVGKTVEKVQADISKFANSQKWANITSLATSAFSGISNVVGGVKTAFEGAYNWMNNFSSQGDKIAKTAKLVGLSAEDYQAFSFAAQRSGMTVETLDSSLRRFNVTLGKAKSGDATALKALGALLPKSVNEYRNQKEVLLDLADSYTKLSVSQKAFVSQEIFGRSGQQMAELFATGSGGVVSLLDRYNELGGGFTSEAAKNAEQLNDDILDLNVTLEAFKILIGSQIMPPFIKLTQTATKFFVKNKDEIRTMVRDFGMKLVDSIQKIAPKIPVVLDGVVAIVSAVASIVDYLGPIKSILAAGILVNIGSVVSAVTSLVGLIGGPAVAAIGAVAVGIGAWGKVVYDVIENFDMLKSFVVDDVCGAISRGFFGAANAVSDAFESAIPKGIVRGVRAAIKAIPVLGDLIFSDVDFGPAGNDIGGEFENMVKNSSTTTTSRFSVDFKNVPKGAKIEAPSSGDFDYSYGYMLGGI